MIFKNEVEEYMFIEYLEAKEHINAVKKRNKQASTVREHTGTNPQRVQTQTSYRDFLFGKAAEQQPQQKEEKEEVKEVVNDSDRSTNEGDGGLRGK